MNIALNTLTPSQQVQIDDFQPDLFCLRTDTRTADRVIVTTEIDATTGQLISVRAA